MQNLMFLLEGNINNLFLLPTSDKGKMAQFCRLPEYSTYDSEDSEDDSDNEVCYPETEVSLLVEKDDIAVIKTSDAHSYYILKLSCQPYIIGQIEKDSYNHTFAGNHKAMGITWKSSKEMFFIQMITKQLEFCALVLLAFVLTQMWFKLKENRKLSELVLFTMKIRKLCVIQQ